MTGDAVPASMGTVSKLSVPPGPDTAARPGHGPDSGDQGADPARRAAAAAAQAAGVVVREVIDLGEIEAVVRLYATIWGRQGNPPVTTELLRAFTKAGNYVAGAFDGPHLVGACVGFFAAPAEDALHSHIAGVAAAALGRGVGFALKLHQRGWALERGVSEIAWTFDPLVSRNAHFNLVKLAAQPAEYLPNFYGSMLDSINGTGDTDRLLVRWKLGDPRVVSACAGTTTPASAAAESAAGAVTAVGVSDRGEPVPGRLDGAVSLVAVPADIETMRTTDPARAQQWRVAVRQALTALAADGAGITGFDRAGWYVVGRPHRAGGRP